MSYEIKIRAFQNTPEAIRQFLDLAFLYLRAILNLLDRLRSRKPRFWTLTPSLEAFSIKVIFLMNIDCFSESCPATPEPRITKPDNIQPVSSGDSGFLWNHRYTRVATFSRGKFLFMIVLVNLINQPIRSRRCFGCQLITPFILTVSGMSFHPQEFNVMFFT